MKDHHIAQMVNKIERSVRNAIPDAPQSLRSTIGLSVSQFMHDVVDVKSDAALNPGIYYRVYQDRESTDGGYYVEDMEGVQRSIQAWRDGVAESDEVLFPVIEPVEMTKAEFDALPEFRGY